MASEPAAKHYRTVFISDVHLGTRGCQAELLLDFIRHMECETLYLVGDIVDGWKMKGGVYWPQAHNDVVQKILRLARKGVQVIYIPGNHDEFARDYCGVHLGGVVVARDAVHEMADGRRFLVLHGDEFDGRGPAGEVAGLPGRLVLPGGAGPEHRLQPAAPPAGLWLLEPVGLSEGQGEERGEVHRRFRTRGGRRGRPARPRTA
jgi:predicted phosphodiesterase